MVRIGRDRRRDGEEKPSNYTQKNVYEKINGKVVVGTFQYYARKKKKSLPYQRRRRFSFKKCPLEYNEHYLFVPFFAAGAGKS